MVHLWRTTPEVMDLKKLLCGALLALCLLLPAACGSQDVAALPDTTQTHPVPDGEPDAAGSQTPQAEPDPVETILQRLSLEEQVGQLFFVRCPEEQALGDLQTYHLGGYLLFGRDIQGKTANELIQTIQHYQDAASLPLLMGVDEEGGSVVRVSANPHLRSEKFASPQRLYQLGGLDRILSDTREKDVLLRALGFQVNLAPVADVSTSPEDFIYSRAFGQDAAATADYISAVTKQMTADGMGSVLKHFPGYGNNADTHTGIARDSRPREVFDQQDFLPFTAGWESGGDLTAVLVSHNIVECMDPSLPASLSPAVHQVLRQELGFSGVVMTDDLAMDAVAAYSADGAAAVMALEAGNDLVLTTDYRTQIPKVLEAVENGTLSQEVIRTACRRVLTWKQALGLL